MNELRPGAWLALLLEPASDVAAEEDAVSDTGIGIPEAEQRQLFTSVFRASNATTGPSPAPASAWPLALA